MSRTKKILLICAAVVVAALAALTGIWLWLGSDDAPASFEASESLAGEQSSSNAADALQEAPDLDGTWIVDPESGADTGVGYRIFEDLPVGGPNEIAARTTAVSGMINIAGSTLESGELSVDVATLDSGNALRDDILRSQFLETEEFPSATLTVGTPVELEFPTTSGELIDMSIPVELTIHGETEEVLAAGQAQWASADSGTVIEVLGTIDTTLGTFGIERPSLAGRTAREEVVVEFKLRFTMAPA